MDAIAPVPVIAAGGIADGRGVVAALALGAEAVWVGTRLVASQEAYAHDEYKRRIVEAEASDTVRTTIFGPESHGMRNELYLRSRTGVRASFIALTFAEGSESLSSRQTEGKLS